MHSSDEANIRAAAPLHVSFLDGVRGLAALYVVLYHLWLFSTLGRIDSMSRWLRPFLVFKFGHSAVDVFIVLSGFCLMLPIARAGSAPLPRGTLNFLYRRARRILPPYYAALALSLIFLFAAPSLRTDWVGSFSLYDAASFRWALCTHLLLIHNLWASTAFRINDPMWSVATEWQIYFVFAFILLPLRRWLGLTAPILFGIAAGWVSDRLGLVDADLWFIGSFAMGMAAAEIAYSPGWKDRLNPKVLGPVTMTVTGIAFCGIWRFDRGEASGDLVRDTVFGCAAALFLLYVTVQSRSGSKGRIGDRVSAFLAGRVPVGLGRFSYSLYLVHFPLLLWLAGCLERFHFDQSAMLATLLCVGLPAVICISYVFHLAFERPFLNTPISTQPPGTTP